MKKLITAALASLALFTFAPIDADAGGKKKNKRAKIQNHKGHNHSSFQSRSYSGHNHGPSSSVRFSFGQPAYRSYYSPNTRYYRPIPRVNTNSGSFYRPSGFSGLSLFFGGRGSHCH